ncbi:ATP-binding cassette domain-containing protein [Rhizobium helianthi]|uniref:ATP-binding cassette domain-containing protein n=1 Tax=Rhizobium helianthi TaxID=1132695 RepID=A0ABW4M4B8_9HYPH
MVELRAVQLRLGDRHFAFDCRIETGSMTAIVGPSGAGKSTLLNLIAGFETPSEGAVFIDGQDVTALHPAERPISIVFQDNNLFAHLDVETNIALGLHPALKLTAADRERIAAALTRVGLAKLGHRKPGTLSGGERQRAAFARALVRRKPVLLLDEPFASLDSDLRHKMADLLKDLHRETGQTIILVSHNADDLEQLGATVLQVDGGQIRND